MSGLDLDAARLPRSLPQSLRLAIRRVVAAAGGDADDAAHLAEVWERVADDTTRRARAMRTAVRLRPCRCFDGGDGNAGDRCARCFGRRG